MSNFGYRKMELVYDSIILEPENEIIGFEKKNPFVIKYHTVRLAS